MNDFLQSLRNGQAEKPRTPKTRKNFDNSYHYTSSPRFNSYGNGYPNTRNSQMKRPPVTQQPGNQLPVDEMTTISMLAEAIENLNLHIETLAKNQDYLITVQEKTADMLERQAIAIERIVSHLDLGKSPQPEHTAAPSAPPAAASDSPKTPFQNHYISSLSPETAAPATPVQPAAAKPVRTVIRKRKKTVSHNTISPAADTGQKLLSREKIMEIIHTMRAEGATFDQVASHLVDLGQPTFSGRGEWHAQTIHRLCNKK